VDFPDHRIAVGGDAGFENGFAHNCCELFGNVLPRQNGVTQPDIRSA
jgi:hypothetical protein